MTTHDIVCNILDNIHHQLIKEIDDSIDFYSPSETEYTHLAPFQHDLWMQESPYIEMRFEFEWSTFNFLQLCNMVEMMFGTSVEVEFSRELTKQVEETVMSRLELVQTKKIA